MANYKIVWINENIVEVGQQSIEQNLFSFVEFKFWFEYTGLLETINGN